MDLKKLLNKLDEATSGEAEWDVDDLIEVTNSDGQEKPKPGEGGGGESREVEDLGDDKGDPKDGESSKGDQKDGESEDEEGADGDDSVGKEGEGKGKDGEEVEVDTGDKKGDEASDSTNGEWIDDHSKLQDSDSTGKDILRKVYKETKAQYGGKRSGGPAGSGGGGFMKRVEQYIKEDFDISKILRRLSSYKKKLSEEKKRQETYQASVFNPVTQQGNIMAKGAPKVTINNEGSTVLFLAADTSGSITTEDYQSIFGYLNDIATKFKAKEHGIDGDVYLIEWDHETHLPPRKWEAISSIKPIKDMTPEEREEFKLRGGGGTDIQQLFDTLDEKFTRTDKDGNVYFTLNEQSDVFKDADGNRHKNLKDTTAIDVKLKKPKESKTISKAADTKAEKLTVKSGEINFLEGKTTNAPFLIVYTDGFFSTPNITKSKLFGASQGNILYVVTSREGIKNIKPKNFLYHDLHGDDL